MTERQKTISKEEIPMHLVHPPVGWDQEEDTSSSSVNWDTDHNSHNKPYGARGILNLEGYCSISGSCFGGSPYKYRRDYKKGIKAHRSAVIESVFQGMEPADFTASYKFILNKFTDALSANQKGEVLRCIDTEFDRVKPNDIELRSAAKTYARYISEIPFKKISFEVLNSSFHFSLILNKDSSDHEYLLMLSMPSVISPRGDVIFSLFVDRELEISNLRPIIEVVSGVNEMLAVEK